MKRTKQRQLAVTKCALLSSRRSSGFSLLELLAAMAVFMIIGGAAFSLVRQHIPLFSSQQSQAGLNIALRNSVAQMQIDVVNAGSGFYPGANISALPLGLIVENRVPTTVCNDPTTHTFGNDCFDRLSIVAADPNTPLAHPDPNGGGSNPGACQSMSSNSELWVSPDGTTTPAQLEAGYKEGDWILIVKNDGSGMRALKLTADAKAVGGGKVKLSHNSAAAGDDPLGINEALYESGTPSNNKLGDGFCNVSNWVLKLSGITYAVDTSDTSNPKLIRVVNGEDGRVIADQVIGFKVGAMIGSGTNDLYNFDRISEPYDSTSIRSVRLSLMGRTTPNSEGSNGFRNEVDGGPYKIQAVSVVISPRNLSMND